MFHIITTSFSTFFSSLRKLIQTVTPKIPYNMRALHSATVSFTFSSLRKRRPEGIFSNFQLCRSHRGKIGTI